MLLEKLQEQLKDAMRAREELLVSTLRLLISAIRNEQFAKMRELTEEEELGVAAKQAKQRREAIESYEKAGRTESAEKEKAELEILTAYLPQQMPSEDLEKIVQDTISEMAVTNLADMGKVIGAVNAKVKGQAEGSLIAQLVKEKLGVQVNLR
ncbi:MAG: GatB/YqeY domain-containing protein [bacterium]|nr:GatB/YqeY domain-containing protein [bacterium]